MRPYEIELLGEDERLGGPHLQIFYRRPYQVQAWGLMHN